MSQGDSEQLTTVFPPSGRQPLPAEPSPSVLATAGPAATTEFVTCPECGTVAQVTLNRRQSEDFCGHCDFPLFWVPSRIQLGRVGDGGDESLRRLPGTVGRATIASLACPHCSEPNAVTGVTCVRCGQSLHPVAPPPPPAPVYVPPAPMPEPEIEVVESGWPWWMWAILVILGAAAIALVTFLILTHTN